MSELTGDELQAQLALAAEAIREAPQLVAAAVAHASTAVQIDLEHLVARQAAFEAVLTQITAPLLEAIEPGLARELIQSIRAAANMPSYDEFHRLAIEEYLQRLADGIEARVRAKIGAGR